MAAATADGMVQSQRRVECRKTKVKEEIGAKARRGLEWTGERDTRPESYMYLDLLVSNLTACDVSTEKAKTTKQEFVR